LIAGIVRAPLTAIIIVFELTKQTSAILPLMLVSTISLILSQKLSRESIYTLRLVKRKLNFKHSAETNLLKTILVKDIFDKSFITIPENTKFNDIVNLIISKKLNCLSVHSIHDKRFMGLISIDTIKEVMFDKELIDSIVIAGDIADQSISKIHLNDDCMIAYEKIKNSSHDGLPVFTDLNSITQIGMLWIQDINEAFHKETENIESTSNFAEKLMKLNRQKDVSFIEGHLISEIQVPAIFAGKSIAALKIRNKYHIEIIAIKKETSPGHYEQKIPHPDYIFVESDLIIITGESENINILRDA